MSTPAQHPAPWPPFEVTVGGYSPFIVAARSRSAHVVLDGAKHAMTVHPLSIIVEFA